MSIADYFYPLALLAIATLLVVALFAYRSAAFLEFLKEHWLHIGFFIACVVGLIVVWMLMSKPNQTPFESQVFSFLLLIFSVAASWVFSKMYAEQSASNSLRDYSVQVARGVMVLKYQLEVLTNWVADKRTTATQPIEDAQLEHIEETLKGFKSLADATLRGIAGVMGDALKQYQDTLNEINNTRTEATKEAAELQAAIASPKIPSEVSKAELALKLQELELRTIQKIGALAQRSSLPIEIPPSQKPVSIKCPSCAQRNEIQIADGVGQTRSAKCPFCDARFNVHSSGSGSYFTRIIALPVRPERAGESLANVPHIAELPTILQNVNFKYSSTQFVETLNVLAGTARGFQDANMPYSINILVQNSVASIGESSSMTSTIVRRVAQFLFWGRLFRFSGPPSFNSDIANGFTRDDILIAFIRCVGFKLGEKAVDLNIDATAKQLTSYFGPVLSEHVSIQRLMEELRLSYDEGLRKQASKLGLGPRENGS